MTHGREERRGAGLEAALLGAERPRERTVEQLWLETLGRISARAAHEVKGALNGVSVNLEVVRGRAARPEMPASSVLRYAESAADQLEALTRMSEALLGLTRPPRRPVDVLGVLRRMFALLAPATAAEGGSLVLASVPEAPMLGQGPCVTCASGEATRLALGAALLAAIEPKGQVVCTVEADRDIRVTLQGPATGRYELPANIVEALGASSIGCVVDGRLISLAFPREPHASRDTPTSNRA